MTPSGLVIPLSIDEYRLALLGAVDFEGNWQALELASHFVVDGPRKGKLIRERLLPVVEHLAPAFERGVPTPFLGSAEALELVAARHWFRNQELAS
jgi:hypothetical protein